MHIPTKKLKIGFEMPVYGLGTWKMGGSKVRDESNNDEADVLAIKSAIESGITHIDTAEVYAEGYSEVILGRAIENFDRSKLFIVSKVKGANMSYDGIINSCKKSLERLKTSYLDLYLLHEFSPVFQLKDSMKALDYLVDQGLIKNIGVCNFNKEHLKEAQSYTKNKIVCNQVHYNLKFREPEVTGLLQYCQENDIFLSAWRPYRDVLEETTPDILKEMCGKYGKTPSQIAINWLISQPYVITLSKTGNKEHLKENLGAIGWEMDKIDIERLRKEYPDQKDLSNSVPLSAPLKK